MGKDTLNYRGMHPMQIVERMLAMQALREIGAARIMMLEQKFHVFTLEEIDDETEDRRYIIDWDFALFEATKNQLNDLIANFVPKKKEGEEKKTPASPIITLNEPTIDIGERPGLIL